MRLAGCCTSADPPRLAKGHPIMPELEKLPQARRYLRAARFGLHTLLELKIAGTGYIFHVIGLLKNPDAPAVKREAEEDWG